MGSLPRGWPCWISENRYFEPADLQKLVWMEDI
jgi:hypothetical protein